MFSGPLLVTRRAREQAELREAADACASRGAELRSGPGSWPSAVQGSSLSPGTPHCRGEAAVAIAAAAAEASPPPMRLAEARPGGPLPAVSLGPQTSLTDAPLLDELLPLLNGSPTSGRREGAAGKWLPGRRSVGCCLLPHAYYTLKAPSCAGCALSLVQEMLGAGALAVPRAALLLGAVSDGSNRQGLPRDRLRMLHGIGPSAAHLPRQQRAALPCSGPPCQLEYSFFGPHSLSL